MLTASQLADFHRDGFLIMRGVFRGRELDLLQAQSALLVDEGTARRGEHHLYLPPASGGGKDAVNAGAGDAAAIYWRTERMFERHAIFRAAAMNPDLLENIGQCIGGAFHPWNHSLVVKIPGGPPVAWHQDPFFPEPTATTPPVPNFTADIYLDHSDEGNGCLWAIPGHHLVGNVDIAGKTQEELFTTCGAKPLVMAPGDVIFHALTTPHGSRHNPSRRTRRTYYLHFINQEAFDRAGYGRFSTDVWGPAKRAQIAAMAADRADLLGAPAAGPFGPNVELTAHGLVCTAPATTPRHHWATLAAAIPAETRERMRNLALHEPAALAAAP
jgi:hypothetical protein